jgi:DNA-binding PadR family transcriptional regulator
MRLTIGENEAALLQVLTPEETRATDLLKLAPQSSIRGTLARMADKGWVKIREVEEGRLYSLTELGGKALDAWNLYSNG